MNTLKDYKEIKGLHRDLRNYHSSYKAAKLELKRLIKEKRACSNSGYLQHYPEYNSMIGQSLSNLKIIKKKLRVTADTLRTIINN